MVYIMILYLSLQSEDLTISKQKTTPPLSSIIQPGLGTGPAPVQHSNNNTNNNTNKRGTVFDEHCVESQEETPVSIHIGIHV